MPSKLDLIHSRVRENRWLKIFTIVTRVLLALAFLPSGITKVMGNRFTVLGIVQSVLRVSTHLSMLFIIDLRGISERNLFTDSSIVISRNM